MAISAGTVRPAHSAVLVGNFIGVLPDGESAAGNWTGVGHVTQLGGSDAASRNLISGNGWGFTGDPGLYNGDTVVVEGNYLGTNASGTKAVPNGTAISLDSGPTGHCELATVDLSNMIIGGTVPGAGNLISGNKSAITLGSVCSYRPRFPDQTLVNALRIKGNLIGVQADGASPLPNTSAISILGSDNVIGGTEAGAGNIIAFSTSGVIVTTGLAAGTSQRNRILSNSIYATRIGIDLGSDGPTANDSDDSDSGPNALQNHPTIESTSITNGTATISGTLNSTSNTQFTLQYFSESPDLARPVQTYLGSATATTDANGKAQFSDSFPVTDPNVSFNMTATSQDGNTSEFSRVPPRLLNISTRAFVGTGDQATIAGFITSSFSRQIVVRALGPSLARGYPPVAGALSDPVLELHQSAQLSNGTVQDYVVASNDNWADDSNAADVSSAGLAPTNYFESALSRPLGAACTAVVRGVGGATGVGLVEVYDVNDPSGELLNISTRALVGTGDDVLIAGTIIEQLPSSTRIVARALGPSLAAAGVTDALADPTLELHDGQGNLVDANDNWGDGEAAALKDVGLAPANDKESAIFIRLASGAYTAVVRGKNDSSGVALVEIYNLH